VLLRQIEVLMSQGKGAPVACREAGISQQSYYRWRKEYGGLELDQAKRMKDLERENVRLKRLVADISLEKQVLKDVASGNFFSIRGAPIFAATSSLRRSAIKRERSISVVSPTVRDHFCRRIKTTCSVQKT
jgi:hypothetical protein